MVFWRKIEEFLHLKSLEMMPPMQAPLLFKQSDALKTLREANVFQDFERA